MERDRMKKVPVDKAAQARWQALQPSTLDMMKMVVHSGAKAPTSAAIEQVQSSLVQQVGTPKDTVMTEAPPTSSTSATAGPSAGGVVSLLSSDESEGDVEPIPRARSNGADQAKEADSPLPTIETEVPPRSPATSKSLARNGFTAKRGGRGKY